MSDSFASAAAEPPPSLSPECGRDVLPTPDLTCTPEILRATAGAYEKVRRHIPEIEWPAYAPYVFWIEEMKRIRNAVILAHNYQTPEIYHCISDFRGDSLQLAREAERVDAEIIVQCGVHFMAETSKLLNPEKTVLIPDEKAGCSLAESITGEDVRRLRETHPGVPIACYVNTSAEVKAECDICCTSSNALQVAESFDSDEVFLIPDEYLALNVAAKSSKKILTWKGRCEVHERFTAEELEELREGDPNLKIAAHPECPPSVVEAADYSGSTSGMIEYAKSLGSDERLVLVTECSMAANIEAEAEGVEFVKPCNLCPHMKRITLPKVLDSLLSLRDEVHVDPCVAERAREAVERMIRLQAN